MNTTTDKSTRPLVVTIAVLFLVMNFGVGLVRDILTAQSYDLRFCFVFAIMLLLEGVTVWSIFRGQNWARWALLAMFLLGAMSSWPAFIERVHDYSALQIVVRVGRLLADLIVLFALFHPSTNQWFLRGWRRRRERQRRQAEIEAEVRHEYEQRLSGVIEHWQRVDIESEIARLVKERMKLMRDAEAV